MSISSIQFNASEEIQRRKEQIRDRNGDSAFSDVFERVMGTMEEAHQSTGLDSVYSAISASGRSGGVLEATELDGIFQRASETYGVPVNLLKAVAKAESNFNSNAVSSAGAMGVMQLMPGTAASLGVSDPYDAQQNIMGGAKYLSDKLKLYDGDVELALAAYNAGSGNVAKYGGVPPFPETQNYIKKIMGYMEQGDSSVPASSYGSTYQNTLNSFYGGGTAGLYDYGMPGGQSIYGGLGAGSSGLSDVQKMMQLSYQQMAARGLQIGRLPDESEER